jgi:hypothetical protein
MIWGKYWSSNLPIIILVICLAIFHSPDGRELRIESQHIAAVRPADAAQQSLAPGTRAILYVGSQKFGVVETPGEVDAIIKDCMTNGEPN